jgi:myo-inositol-1(or 4)-monophosphatase
MQQQLDMARQVAREAGAHLLSLFGKATVQHKGQSYNLVTQADVESEELIVRRIREVFPTHAFLGEEGAAKGNHSEANLWVIDPLDATNNYAHSIPHFSVSIAYAERGQVQVGAVYDPSRNELFSAVRGQGAFLNDRPIHTSSNATLDKCIIGTGFYYDRGAIMQKTLDTIAHLFSHQIHGIRRMGSAAIDLSWVACGRFDAFFEYTLAPWDYAAGALIIEEAGGRCADRLGAPWQLGSGNIMAANSHIFEQFIKAARWK